LGGLKAISCETIKTVSETLGCEGCPMRTIFPENTFVKPREGNNLRLAIGEAPGAQEAEEGKPFVGGSGRWLNVIYGKAGCKESDNSVINVIQCRPKDNIFPTDSDARGYISESDAHIAVQHCIKNHVEPFFKSRPWQRVDTFGDKPLKFLLGKSGGVTNWRGSVLPVPAMGTTPIAVPTFHPAYIARDQSMLPVAINDIRKTLEIEPEHYEIYPTIAQVRSFRFRKFAFDIECNRWNNDEISLVGLSASPFHAMAVPFTGEYITELIRIFGEAEEVIGQNILQFDLPILARQGVKIRGPKECHVWDIMLMHHLRFPVFPHNLEFIGKQFTNKGAWKADKAIFEIYNARDVDVTFRCFGPLKELLEQAHLLDVYNYISWPLALICKSMTDAGVMLNGNRLKELRADYLKQVEELEKQLPPELASTFIAKRKRKPAPEGTVNDKGKPVKFVYEEYQEKITPWRSAEVKKEYLYKTLGLPVQKHIKTKEPTVDKGALDKLYAKTKHPVLKLLKELSKYATLLSGFAKEDLESSDALHPSFNVHGTGTGRLSSSGPNIQNQPGKVRYMYVSRFTDGRIVAADFSGIENRLTCFLAKDKARAARLEDKEFSEHKYLVSKFFDIPYDKVEKSHDKDSPYAICKIIVHGSDRVMGARKIAEQFDMDFNTVKKVQAAWKSEIQATIDWQNRVMGEATRTGCVTNPFDRKLWIWTSGSGPEAVSFFPQSTAADVIFRAMIGLMYERIGWPKEWAEKVCPITVPLPDGAVMFIQVHDELVIDCRPEVVRQVREALQTVMTQPWKELKNLSLPVAINAGVSWGDC
jgi:uracil-DNA glycosylase family 4